MKTVFKAMIISIIVNFILIVIKFVVGVITNYKSLIADAVHSFSDMSTDVVAILGQWLAVKKADDNHPYGHGRIEYVTSIAIGVFILLLGVNLISSVFTKTIVEYKFPIIALIVVMITIVLKYWLSKYVYCEGKKINNNILIASAEENKTDVLSSVGVFVAIFLSMFQEYVPIFKYADKIGSAIISLMVIKTAYNIFRDNFKALIGECEQDEKIINEIKDIINKVTDVKAIDKLVVMKFGSYYQVVLDVGVDGECKLSEAHDIAHIIEEDLINSNLKIKYVVVHINPYEKKY